MGSPTPLDPLGREGAAPHRRSFGSPGSCARPSLDERLRGGPAWTRRCRPHASSNLAARLRYVIDEQEHGVSWVDRALADLSKAAGTPLPGPLRAFGRRVLEFPKHYHDLHAMARACHLSRGALKARFRRRGLESPYTYLRWFRVMAVASLLSDREVAVAQAAYRLGFTSDGNLCRAIVSLTGLTPTDVRTVRGWNRLLITFAWTYLTGSSLHAWAGLSDELFEQRAA